MVGFVLFVGIAAFASIGYNLYAFMHIGKLKTDLRIAQEANQKYQDDIFYLEQGKGKE